jgi:hypothetical protein
MEKSILCSSISIKRVKLIPIKYFTQFIIFFINHSDFFISTISAHTVVQYELMQLLFVCCLNLFFFVCWFLIFSLCHVHLFLHFHKIHNHYNGFSCWWRFLFFFASISISILVWWKNCKNKKNR